MIHPVKTNWKSGAGLWWNCGNCGGTLVGTGWGRERDLFYETEPKHDVQKEHRDTPLLLPEKNTKTNKNSLANDFWRHRLLPAGRVAHESSSFAIHLWDRYDLYTVQLVAFPYM
jgi:hypothetical protein